MKNCNFSTNSKKSLDMLKLKVEPVTCKYWLGLINYCRKSWLNKITTLIVTRWILINTNHLIQPLIKTCRIKSFSNKIIENRCTIDCKYFNNESFSNDSLSKHIELFARENLEYRRMIDYESFFTELLVNYSFYWTLKLVSGYWIIHDEPWYRWRQKIIDYKSIFTESFANNTDEGIMDWIDCKSFFIESVMSDLFFEVKICFWIPNRSRTISMKIYVWLIVNHF